MTRVSFFTDEDVYAVVAIILRKAGFDAVSSPECNRLGESDNSQLEWASAQRRALVTFNVAHFAALHSDWLQAGKHHAGVIVSSQRPIGELARRLSNLGTHLDAESLRDRLEFLGDW